MFLNLNTVLTLTKKKITEIIAIGISEKVAEVWAVKYWNEYVNAKKEMLEDIQKRKKKSKTFLHI